MKTIEIVNTDGARRSVELVRFEGLEHPIAVVKWGLAGAYRLELATNRLVGTGGVPIVNWSAADVEQLREEHAAWRRGRSENARPAVLKGAQR